MKSIIPKLPLEERLLWAKAPFTPKEVIAELAGDQNRKVRLHVALNPSAPGGALERLAQEDRLIRQAVGGNPNAPKDLLEALAKDKNHWVRYEVAVNPNTPLHVLEELAQATHIHRGQDMSHVIHQGVAKNPSTPHELLRRFAKVEWLRSSLASNPSCPPDLLEELVEEKPLAAAMNPSLPGEVLRQLAQKRDARIKEALARNPSAPKDILAHLAKDRDYDVRRGVAGNPSTPPVVLRQLAQEKGGMRTYIAANPNAPLSLLGELIKDPYHLVKEQTFTNPSLTLESLLSILLPLLEKDPLDPWVAYKLLPFLDDLPQDYTTWAKIWRALDEKGRKLFRAHPFGAQVALLGALGS